MPGDLDFSIDHQGKHINVRAIYQVDGNPIFLVCLYEQDDTLKVHCCFRYPSGGTRWYDLLPPPQASYRRAIQLCVETAQKYATTVGASVRRLDGTGTEPY